LREKPPHTMPYHIPRTHTYNLCLISLREFAFVTFNVHWIC
jgi:hypothetical protein